MLKVNVESEISKVLYDLGFPQLDEVRDSIVDKFVRVQHCLRESPKYSTIEKLTPIIIYIYLTLHNFRIDKSKLITVSSISHSEFYHFFDQLNYYISRLCS